MQAELASSIAERAQQRRVRTSTASRHQRTTARDRELAPRCGLDARVPLELVRVAPGLAEVARVERPVDRRLAKPEVVVRDRALAQEVLALREPVAALPLGSGDTRAPREHQGPGEARTDLVEQRPALVEPRACAFQVARAIGDDAEQREVDRGKAPRCDLACQREAALDGNDR